MTTLSEIEILAQDSRATAIRTATALFKVREGFSDDRVELLIDSIITAAMMEIAAMQVKIVEEAKK